MPVPKKKPTTLTPEGSMPKSPSPVLPERDLVTSTGRIEDLNVPRDREGMFHSQVFERYSRYEPEVAEALTQMFISGTSTHKVGEVAQTLMGEAPSASSVSRLNQTLALPQAC